MSLIPGASGSPTTMTDGILGVTDGSSAAAGNVGENLSSVIATGSALSATTNTALNITSISLTNGCWLLSGAINWIPAASTTPTQLIASTSRTSATLPASTTSGAPNTNGEYTCNWNQVSAANAASVTQTIPPFVVNVSGGTVTQYLVGKATFTTSTMTVNGHISAVRLR